MFRLYVKNPEKKTLRQSLPPSQLPPTTTPTPTPTPPPQINQTDLNMIKQRLETMQSYSYRVSVTTNMLGRLMAPVQGCRTCGMLK